MSDVQEMQAWMGRMLEVHAVAFTDPEEAVARRSATPQEMYVDRLSRCPVKQVNDYAYRLLRMDDILYVNKHPDVIQGSRYLGSTRPAIPLGLDGQEQRKWRKFLDPAFTAKRVEPLAPQIRAFAHGLLDEFAGAPSVDAYTAFCEPLPSTIFLSIMGLPMDDLRQFIDYKNRVLSQDPAEPHTDERVADSIVKNSHRQPLSRAWVISTDGCIQCKILLEHRAELPGELMPLQDDIQVVSVDDHVIEHPGVFQDRLPARFKERGPRIEHTAEGADIWMYDGVPHPNIGLNAVAGKDRKDYGLDPTAYDAMRPGCYRVEDRLADMDIDGIHAQLCFPTFPGFAGSTFFRAPDKELAAACVSAWNDWMIDEWAGGMPGRQIPLALVPYWDIDATVAEATRIIERGAKTISFTEMPHALGLPSFHSKHWDPFLAVVSEAEVPLSLHFGSGGAPTVASDAPFTTAIALFGLNSQMATIDLMNTRLFERFPKLKFAMSEGGIGWMPYILERADYTWERHRYYTGMVDARRPSDIFRDHIFGCFIADDAGLANIDRIGEDNIMFEADYPHSDSNFPHARKMLAESLVHVPDAVARKIAEDNARKLFKFPR